MPTLFFSLYACLTAFVTASLTAILASSISSYVAPALEKTPESVKRIKLTYSADAGTRISIKSSLDCMLFDLRSFINMH